MVRQGRALRRTVEHRLHAGGTDRHRGAVQVELQVLRIHPGCVPIPGHAHVTLGRGVGACLVYQGERLIARERGPSLVRVAHVEVAAEDHRMGIVVGRLDKPGGGKHLTAVRGDAARARCARCPLRVHVRVVEVDRGRHSGHHDARHEHALVAEAVDPRASLATIRQAGGVHDGIARGDGEPASQQMDAPFSPLHLGAARQRRVERDHRAVGSAGAGDDGGIAGVRNRVLGAAAEHLLEQDDVRGFSGLAHGCQVAADLTQNGRAPFAGGPGQAFDIVGQNGQRRACRPRRGLDTHLRGRGHLDRQLAGRGPGAAARNEDSAGQRE